MIPFTVIGGYLGAGKTTLLNRILNISVGTRFALIVNDFGEVNIDAGLISSQSETQINLTNGCVCCSLSDGFSEALDQLLLLEPKPEHIVVEASGVADVANLSQYGRAPGLRLDSVLVLVDAESLLHKANDKYVGQTFRRQLGAADLIVLNKTDLVSDDELVSRRQWLEAEYPDILLLEATHAMLPLAVLLGIHEHSVMAGEVKSLAPERVHEDHAHYQTWHYQTDDTISASSLQTFAAKLPGFVLRAKGLFRTDAGGWLQLQVVGARAEVDPIKSGPEVSGGEMIAIGLAHEFDATTLDDLASSLLLAGAR